ncbi:MAG: tetratricopeptide repeat protein [Alphaproteobacteria bacterium]|nr:tetratricopeptide repeat protein [Alphaproteobacteria bacterium]
MSEREPLDRGAVLLALLAGIGAALWRMFLAPGSGWAPGGDAAGAWLSSVVQGDSPMVPILLVPPVHYVQAMLEPSLGADAAIGLRAVLGGLSTTLAAVLSARLAPASPKLAAGFAGLMAALLPASGALDLLVTTAALTTTLAVATALGWEAAVARKGLGAVLVAALCSALLLGATPGAAVEPSVVGLGPDLTAAFDASAAPAAVAVDQLPEGLAARQGRARLVASRRAGTALDDAQTERAWLQRGLERIGADPGRALGLVLWRAHHLLRTPELYGDITLSTAAAHTAFGPLAWRFRMYGALGIVGLLAVPLAGGRRRGIPVLVVAGLLLLGLSVLSASPQQGAPLLPLFAAGSGVAIAALSSALLERRYLVLVGLLVAVAGLRVLLAQPPESAWLPGPALAASGYVPAAPCAQHVLAPRAVRLEEERQRARDAVVRGDAAEALQRLRAAVDADPGFLAARADLAQLLLDQGKPSLARSLAEKVLEDDPCMDGAWATLGIARLRERDHRGAAHALERAVEIDPYVPAYEAALGTALLALGEDDRAVGLLESAVRWDPDLLPAHASLGRYRLEHGDAAGALPLLARASELAPDAIELQALHGLALIGTGDLAGARAILARAEAAGVGHHLAMQTLARGLEQAGGGGFQGFGGAP